MMYISRALDRLPKLAQTRMVHSGIGVWVVWSGQLDPTFNQLMSDYGGFRMCEESNQALWFFFGEEAWYALARMRLWGRVNDQPALIAAMPATILISPKFEMSLSLTVEISRQQAEPPEHLTILVHPNLKAQLAGMPGLATSPTQAPQGLARVAWESFEADPGLAYDSPLVFAGVVKPLGDPLDKNTSGGWRAIHAEHVSLLERMGLKYLAQEGFLIFALDGLKTVRAWCREVMAMIARPRDDEGKGPAAWPSVMAVSPRKGMSLSKDLPRRLGLDWDILTPNCPHMSYRAAFLLGEGFRINEARYTSRGNSVDDWCSVSPVPSEAEHSEGAIALTYSTNLMAGRFGPCFYCGLANHDPAHCPSKALAAGNPGLWTRLADVDIERLDAMFQELDTALANNTLEGIARFLSGKDDKDMVLRAVFEVNFCSQTRMIEAVWRSRGKDLPAGLSQLGPREGEHLWGALDALRAGDAQAAEQFLAQALLRYARGYQPRCLQGFLVMEAGDWVKAVYYWQEAGRLAYTPLQRAYCLFLQGRAMEMQADYQKATAHFRQALVECPRWIEPIYRQGVCMVKMGFIEQGMRVFEDLMRDDPGIFNRVMIDPELERGRVHVLSALWRPWSDTRSLAQQKVEDLRQLAEAVHNHFLDGDPFLAECDEKLKELDRIAKIQNYVAFYRFFQGFEDMRADLRKKVESEIKDMQLKMQGKYAELLNIQGEAAWFPFPKLLKDFNRDFNFCATKLNWMRQASLKTPENFRKTREYLPQLDERIRLLRTRLISLKVVRDSTYFVMLLGRNFVWFEVVCLGLSLVLVPVFVYVSQYFGLGWLAELLERQKWQLQKGLVLILSIMALALAAIKTALTFDYKKKQLFKLAGEGKLPGQKKSAKPKPKPKAKPKEVAAAAPAKTPALPPGKGPAKGKGGK